MESHRWNEALASSASPGQFAGMISRIASTFLDTARFFTRLPIPACWFETAPHGAPSLKAMAPMAPLIGALINLAAALVLWGFANRGLSGFTAAIFAVAMQVLLTGALHEDGLADCCDGLGGGRTPERRLEIMRDSRIGSFGAAGLMLALMARVALLGELTDISPLLALVTLVGAGAISRVAALAPASALPPARAEGAGHTAGQLPIGRWVLGLGVAMSLNLLLWLTIPQAVIIGLLAGSATTLVLIALAQRLIGGQTGDIAGAAQQLCEIAFLAGILMFAASRQGLP